MSRREKALFLELASDEARDRFMTRFWQRRDPTPGTPRNEFREGHQARLAEADRMFTLVEAIPGRLTERGRAYQLLGPPQSREDFSHAGNGGLFPLELWHYIGRTEPFLAESFYLIYFREGGQGDYRLWKPGADGVQALISFREPGRFLLDEAGAYQQLERVDLELAQAVRSLVPGDATPFASVSLLVDIESYADMVDRYGGLETRVRAASGFRELRGASTAAVLYDTAGIPQVHYALEVPAAGMRWREEGERFLASFGVTCRMTDRMGRTVDGIEDWIDVDLSEAERMSLEGQALSFQGRLILPTGRYRLDFTLVSTPAGARYTASMVVNVPVLAERLPPGDAYASSILLARSRQELAAGRFVDRFPFQVDHAGVLNPSPAAVFPATDALAYVQLSGLPAGTPLDWSLRSEGESGEVVWKTKSTLEPEGQEVFRISQVVPLGNVADGDYLLRVVTPGLVRESRLTVDRAMEVPTVRAFSRESPAAGDGRIRLQRALLFVRIGDREGAIRELTAASRLRPRDLEIHLKLAVLLYAAHRYAAVVESLEAIAPHYPRESDVLVLLGFASLQVGDAEQAVSYLEEALALRPDDGRLASALDRARTLSPD